MDFMARFNALLNECGVTTYKISKETDLGLTLLNYWKNGTRQPALDNLIKLADYFDVSIDYLVGRTDRPEVNR